MSLTDADKPLTIQDWYTEVALPEESTPEQPAPSGRPGHLLRKAGKLAAAGVLAAIPAAGMVEGAYIAATDIPTTINLGDPGLNVDAAASFSNHSTIAFGAPGTLRLPAAHKHEPMVGDVAVTLRVREVDIDHPDRSDAEALLPLVEDNGHELKSRITTAVAWRAAEGAGVGLGAGILTDLALVGGTNWLRTQDKQHIKRRLAIGATAMALVGAPLVAAHVHDETPASPRIITPIDQSLTELSPILAGASFSGTGGQGANSLIELADNAKTSADQVWQHDFHAVAAKIHRLEHAGKLPWLGDPNTVAAMQVTDVHGNYPFMKYYLPELIRRLHVDVVMLTGDQENTGGTSPLDSYAWEFLHGLEPKYQDGRAVRVVYAGGNHDPLHLASSIAHLQYRDNHGQSYHPVISLDHDNGYTTRLDGLTFVGSPDRNRTTTENTVPFLLGQQLANDEKQGEQLADVACAAKNADGHSPIVLTHEESAGYASILQGCASVALSGHFHMTAPIKVFRAGDGSTEYLQNLGSASGDGPNNWKAVYSAPTAPAVTSVWLFDKTTGQPTGQVRITAFGSKAPEVSIVQLPNPTKARYPWDYPALRDYIQQYEPRFDASSLIDHPSINTTNNN